jgi:hypothetical protein
MDREPPGEGMAATPHNQAEREKIAKLIAERCSQGTFGVQVITVMYENGSIQTVREGFERRVA